MGVITTSQGLPDTLPPNTASGIRVGTPATTTRGFGPDEMRTVARLITHAIETREDPAEQATLAGEVAAIVERFPVPGLVRA